MAQIKGISLMHARRFAESELGPGVLRAVEERLDPAALTSFRGALASGWYPLGHLVAVEKLVVEHGLGGDLAQAWRIGDYDIRNSIHSVLKVFLRAFNVTYLMQKSAQMWRQMVDSGAMVAQRAPTGNVAHIEVTGFDPIDHVYCEDIRGSCLGALTLCGGREARIIHERCTLRGDDRLTYRAEWKD